MNWKKRKKRNRILKDHGLSSWTDYQMILRQCSEADLKARLQRSIYEAACNIEFKYNDVDYSVQELPVKYTFSFHVEVDQNEDLCRPDAGVNR